MTFLRRLFGESFDVGCRIDIEHTNESLHVHVELDNDLKLNPGDKVTVHGAPVNVPFSGTLNLTRRATVNRANMLSRLWTRLTSEFEITELYEVSFSERRMS